MAGRYAELPEVGNHVCDIDEQDEANVCPICLSSLSCAAVFKLPGCGHEFHALCLASTLHQSMLCPLCRADVAPHACRDVASVLVADNRSNAATFAPSVSAEMVGELRKRDVQYANDGPTGRGASARAIVESLKEVACDKDGRRIAFVASLLGRGNNAPTRAWHPPEVRVAAVDALKSVIPHARFNEETSAVALGVDLLTQLFTTIEEDEVVRNAALFAIRQVCTAGDERIVAVLQRSLIEESSSNSNERLRRAVADALQGLAQRGHMPSMRAAMVVFQDPNRESGMKSIGLGILRQICIRGECAEIVEDLTVLAAGHEDTEVRKGALELLGQAEEYGGIRGTTCAVAQLSDRDMDIRQAALNTLRNLWQRGDKRGVETLVALISQVRGDVEVRRAALDILSEVAQANDADAVSAAACAISDRDDSVRGAAVRAVRQIATRGNSLAVSMAVSVLAHRDDDMRRCALDVLASLAVRDDADTVAAIRGLLRSSNDDMTRLAAEQALSRIG